MVPLRKKAIVGSVEAGVQLMVRLSLDTVVAGVWKVMPITAGSKEAARRRLVEKTIFAKKFE